MARKPDRCRKLLKMMEMITILIMLAILFVGMSSNLSINKTLDVYSHKNIFNTKLTFKDRFQTDEENEGNEEPTLVKNNTKFNYSHQILSNLLNSTNSRENFPKYSNKNENNQTINIDGNQWSNKTYATQNETNSKETQEKSQRILTDDEFLAQKQVDIFNVNTRKITAGIFDFLSINNINCSNIMGRTFNLFQIWWIL